MGIDLLKSEITIEIRDVIPLFKTLEPCFICVYVEANASSFFLQTMN